MRPFVKMTGCGNDFVVLEASDLESLETASTGFGVTATTASGSGQAMLDKTDIRAMCDRRNGIGCDQLLVIAAQPVQMDARSGAPVAAVSMQIYNSDGSEALACGNATRCVAQLWMDRELEDDARREQVLAAGEQVVVVITASRTLRCWRALDRSTPSKTIPSTTIAQDPFQNVNVFVDMGLPEFEWTRIPLSRDVQRGSALDAVTDLGLADAPKDVASLLARGVAVGMGNPHLVFLLPSEEQLNQIDVRAVGSKLETNALFPQGVNVTFAAIGPAATTGSNAEASRRILAKVWERGAGETLACGSAACAVIAAAQRTGVLVAPAATAADNAANQSVFSVQMPGGTLQVGISAQGTMVLAGPSRVVFVGVYSPPSQSALTAPA
ncbi:diaminopimelate epimerase [Capsaspora owczarzaki ATCC 30864]|uniref:diaminopimelate epimerase n=1 Tax=Capsaspora owczarzaki (strain ATCC 30864) TaxID=595528 RepID=A0A0D2VFR0_CAPO3|nr:diaminopimelate epimerase [Capsaspora owczarzaki ATCC 30864]KJE88572.1 diaminopimelate epimerase [Capsaspora owczarzaki ATCC 30864]|eukprot:XP_004365081.2 diaminopimelate epimerase [Capsaspora owczarzaki ATCC 30864]